ncbi:MAG: hypothetical protein NC211_04145 [Alistipes senegalensis]|nr:hypothetical protein [Oxalobacter formigenes]MCM1281007.1 hypothetical protein [Alistipes senegalensis]
MQQMAAAPVLPVWILVAGIVAASVLVAVVMLWQHLSRKRLDENREKRRIAREQEQEQAEMRSLLCSARHELAFFYMNCREGAGEMLRQANENGYLEHIVPVEHERYYIYPICASNIGKVKDAQLGMQILFAYTVQIRFIEAMKWNNNLLRWLREAKKNHKDYREGEAARTQEELEEELKKHRPKVQAAFDEMEVATRTILEYINEDGTINPRSKHKLHSRYYFLNSPQSVRYR